MAHVLFSEREKESGGLGGGGRGGEGRAVYSVPASKIWQIKVSVDISVDWSLVCTTVI